MNETQDVEVVVSGTCHCGGYGILWSEEVQRERGTCHTPIAQVMPLSALRTVCNAAYQADAQSPGVTIAAIEEVDQWVKACGFGEASEWLNHRAPQEPLRSQNATGTHQRDDLPVVPQSEDGLCHQSTPDYHGEVGECNLPDGHPGPCAEVCDGDMKSEDVEALTLAEIEDCGSACRYYASLCLAGSAWRTLADKCDRIATTLRSRLPAPPEDQPSESWDEWADRISATNPGDLWTNDPDASQAAMDAVRAGDLPGFILVWHGMNRAQRRSLLPDLEFFKRQGKPWLGLDVDEVYAAIEGRP